MSKSIEEQIGHLGAIPQDDNASSVGQKLKHMNTEGSQRELSEQERDAMNDFLEHARTRSAEQYDMNTRGMSISEGWIPVDRSEMGVRDMFYPEDWTFYVRPATVEAIKNWSSIDEERIDVVNAVLNDIMKSCVSVRSASGSIPWHRINSWDRFWFVLKIREYTFKNGEARIEFTDTCSECEQDIQFTLTPYTLFYEFPDDELVQKHWNAVERAWYIDPKDYDVDAPVVKLYVPTLEKDQAILDWAIAKQRDNKKVDAVFLKFLPWMLSKVPKDEQVLDKFINECNATFKKWDVTMFEFMDDVVRNITINPSEQLKQICPHCGEEVVSSVRFPNGIKALFKTEAKHKRFGSR